MAGVFIHWTGGLDWTGLEWTGLTQKSIKCLFQCRTEAKHTYSFTKVACIACFRVFLRLGRGFGILEREGGGKSMLSDQVIDRVNWSETFQSCKITCNYKVLTDLLRMNLLVV